MVFCLLLCQVLSDSFDVEVDDGLRASVGFEEGKVFEIVHKEVFCQDCRAEGVTEDVVVFFEVGVCVSLVFSDFVAGEVFLGCGVETGGESVGFGVSFCRVCAPASCGHPPAAVSCCVDVD